MVKMIYQTTFKKGNIVQTLHFEHTEKLTEAVSTIKNYLEKKHLKHIHTVPFLINPHENDEEEYKEEMEKGP